MAVQDRARPPQPGGPPGEAAELLGRRAERAAIDAVLGGVRDGLGGRLVLRGQPGVGKTVLLRYAAGASPDLRHCATAGAEPDIHVAFGGLRRLLDPLLPMVSALPDPQRNALRVAFGDQAGPPPELFLAGLATLTVLTRAAGEQPLLCVVDDAHWLDHESAQVLGFAARRLRDGRAGLIASVDDLAPPGAFEQLPAITVDGLPASAARTLLESAAGGTLSAPALDRILADTRASPLALAELGRAYPADQLSGRAARLEPLPLSRRLQERFLRQLRDLPAEARTFILLAAADPAGEQAPLWRAAARAGLHPDPAAGGAGGAGVLEFPGRSVRFRCPLVRSAVYHGASAADRRHAHQVLGEAGHPELRAWHRATAAAAPDEELAADLQRAAERGAARGDFAARAALLRHAAHLTPDAGDRAAREIALAGASLAAGDPLGAGAGLDSARPRLASAAARGQAESLEGAIRFARGDAAGAARVLARAARAPGHGDRLARDTMLAALEAAIWSGAPLAQEIARRARAFPPVSGAGATVSDLLLAGYSARFTLGYQASVPPLRAAVAALLADGLDPAVGLRWSALGTMAAGSLWDDRAAFELSDRWVQLARAAGALTALPAALSFRSLSDAMAGRFREADTSWAQLHELLSRIHGRAGPDGGGSPGSALALTYRGHLAEGRAGALAGVPGAGHRRPGGPAGIGCCLAAIAELLAGDYPAAMSGALAVIEDDLPYTAEVALPGLVEAAVRAGEPAAAGAAYETMSQRALAVGTPWALGLRSRCAALLAGGADAEDLYRESVRQLRRCGMVVDQARSRLLYGQWLRRARRWPEARRELHAAHDMLAAMGAERLARQAAAELRAAGVRARAPDPQAALDLTPQESRIAGLVAAGGSNAEIAAQLFISPSTVDYHLRKVFRKLNITSRTQLAARLPPRHRPA